jgi:hypothetical protein
MREEHEAHKPDPQDVEAPSENGKAYWLNHTYDANNDENDCDWFENLTKLLKHH